MAKSVKTDVTIGADPELGFLDQVGFIREARRVFDWGPGESATTARFGCDGTDAIAELRPSPSRNPLNVVRNIRMDMAEGLLRHKKIQGLTWKAGTLVDHYTLGGHVHFGAWEYMMAARSNSERGDLTGHPAMGSWSLAMNMMLAVPCILLERPSEAVQRRTQTGYGGASPYGTFSSRVFTYQQHGFEYRPLASWVTSPYVAAGILCLSKAIADDLLSDNLKSDDLSKLYKDSGWNAWALEHYDEAQIRKMHKVIWPKVRELGRYEQYKEYIEFLDSLISVRASWYPKVPLTEAWGLPTGVSTKKEADCFLLENELFTEDLLGV